MALLSPANKNPGNRGGGRRRKSTEDIMKDPPLKNHLQTENICEGCDRLKRRTHFNEDLFGFFCTAPACKNKEREAQKAARREARSDTAIEEHEAEKDAADYENIFEENNSEA